MIIKDKISKNSFTLIELMAAMGVFAIIMLIMLTFFSSAQKAWTNCINRGQIYENARIAMDLITRDLQCVYYEVNRVPFWNKGYTNCNDSIYNQQMLAFVSLTSIPPSLTSNAPNDNCRSKFCEIKYQLYNCNVNPTPTGTLEGWLLRSVTGDTTDTPSPAGSYPNSKRNYYLSTPWPPAVAAELGATNVFTCNSDSCRAFQKVIPYVTKLEFQCFDRNGNPLPADSTTNGTTGAITAFPYSVRIELTLLDQSSWIKWKAMGGRRYVNSSKALVDSGTAAENFRVANERTFVKTVLLGERGQ